MRRYLAIFFISLLAFAAPGRGQAALPAQTDPDPEVDAILAAMGPEERVGQLFLVTFYGPDTGSDSDIAFLIDTYRVGGVVLSRANNNLAGDGDLVSGVYRMTSNLQRLAAGIPPDDPAAVPRSGYVPLFIAIEQEARGGPYTNLLSGLTPQASNMAIGATWDPRFAEAAGRVLGAELSALGFNLLLGPTSDVVEVPQPFTTGDLGSRVFGGETFWVSRMAAAYVRGVHQGSEGRMVVVPRHFPGYGGADRLPSVEIPTVQRSRDQLIQVDLKPFFAVTGDAVDPLEVADGLLVGHIRYQGFQDNRRLLTKPISLDQVALQNLLGLGPISTWRANGGLVISDALGLRGVRRYYDPQEQLFPGRRVALDAFFAGNDVLYLGEFGTNPAVNQTQEIADTIDFFVQRYQDDAAFQEQVDAAVRRIIRKKLDLYGSFTLDTVLPDESGLALIGGQRDVTFDVARNALTILRPDQAELVVSPQRGERIVVFTDARTERQCAACAPEPLIPVNALRSAILRQFGPEFAGLVSAADISAYSFDDLAALLDAGPALPPLPDQPTPELSPLPFALNSADWVVFVMLDVNPEIPSSSVVKRFLAESPASSDVRVVVLAMGAPYYLDSTEISKLTAYYALYGYTEPFIDVGARALFQELAPVGSSTVSIGGLGYDILRATSPDPGQVISLSYSLEGDTESTQTPPADIIIEQGDTLRLSTGVILDYNQHAVPDGTPVDFILSYETAGVREFQSVTTTNGVAQASIVLARPGEVRITAASGFAVNSTTIRIVLGSAGVDVLFPDITATATLVPSPTPELPVTEISEPTPSPLPEPEPPEDRSSVDFSDLLLALVGLAALSLGLFLMGFLLRGVNAGLALALPAVIAGLIGYNYYALMLPGSALWRAWVGDRWGAGLAAWVSGLGGLVAIYAGAYAWQRWVEPRLRHRQLG